MKRDWILVFLFLLPIVAFGQFGLGDNDNKKGKDDDEGLSYINDDASVDKFHTEMELDKKGKIELTEIYIERVRVLSERLPYIALQVKPGATLRDMGIPQTKSNKKQLEDAVDNKKEYHEAVKKNLEEIVPYADKKNIIWSILFLEEMIHDLNKADNMRE